MIRESMLLCPACSEVEHMMLPRVLRKAADALYADNKTRTRSHYYNALADWQDRNAGKTVRKEP